MTQITVKSVNTKPVHLEVAVSHNNTLGATDIYAGNGTDDLPT